MQVLCFPVGEMSANCYLLIDEPTQTCFILDPGDDAEFLSSEILTRKLNPQAILLTHGHFDHLMATLELKLNFSIPVYLHPLDKFLYQRAQPTAQHFQVSSGLLKPPPKTLDLFNHQILHLGQSEIQVIHTPGHTPGSVCFYQKPHLFTGDTLFLEGPGKADRAYSSSKELKASFNLISHLPSETLVYPGHQDQGFPLDYLHLT